MSKSFIPQKYKSELYLYETQTAIGMIKRIFEDNLCKSLSLKRISAPLFVEAKTGLNDDLNGIERPVSFDILETKTDAQVVQSLAKWKRMALHQYDFHLGNGICTDMNAIRRDEEMDNIHSIYVDQWDWEKIIAPSQRTFDHLMDTVTLIVNAICDTLLPLKQKYPYITTKLQKEVYFITSQELLELYPALTPKQREHEITKKHKTVFIMQIGEPLSDGIPHDKRAPDYDDWQLNGDILFWNEILEMPLEISSMGIRVDSSTLAKQLEKANCNHRKELEFHKLLLQGSLPLTMGGGIGQSRLCMLLLQKAHICEVQASVWDEQTIKVCKENKVSML